MDGDVAKVRDADAGGRLTARRFALLLGLFLFAAFPKVMLGLEAFFYRDYGVLGYPFVFYHHQSFWRGEFFPLWNPLSNCGAPLLAQWGTMTLYPLSLVYLVFPLPWSLSYFCLGHLFLAGLGMYFLAHRWTGCRYAAGVAGLAYVANGVMFSCLLWPNYTVALGWMPWVVLAVERSWREGGRWIVGAAVVSALQLLSGVPEIVLLTWMLLGALWLVELARANGARGAMAGRFALVVLLAAGLTAAQLLPFLDLLEHSQRERGFAATTKWAMPGWGWANLLVPLFHCFETYQGPFFQHGQAFMTSYYLGAGILVLAVWAAWRVRERRVWLLAGAAVLGLILALGENGFLFGWLKKSLPLIGIARYPIKFVILAAFAVPLLAGFAIREFVSAKAPAPAPSRRSLLRLGTAALLLMAAVLWFARQYPYPLDQWPATWRNAAGRALVLASTLGLVLFISRRERGRWRRAAQLGLFLLLAVDVLTHTARQNPSLPTAHFAPGLWAAENKTSPPKFGESRALLTPSAEERLLTSTVSDVRDDFLGKRLALWSNLNLLDEIPKVNGSSTLQVREQAQVQSLIYGPTNRVSRGLLDFLGVSMTTALDNPTAWWHRTNHLGLATVGQKPIFAPADETLRALSAPDFDPQQTVYLLPEARASVAASNRTEARIVSQLFSSRRVALEVESQEASLLVVAQSFYPAWRASVDGRPAPLLRANHAFQAVPIPAGRHHVLLRYADRPWVAGAVISALTLLGCGVWWFWPHRTGEESIAKTKKA